MSNLPKKMKAIVAYGPGNYKYQEIDTPITGPNDIIIKVDGCGICGSDLKCYHGASVYWGEDGKSGFVEAPFIPGHEFFGTIVDMGEKAQKRYKFQLGDKVTSEMIIPCGECRFCKEGNYWMCQKSDIYGFKNYLSGAMAEFMKFPEKAKVFKLPNDIQVEKGVLIEPFSCSMHAVERGNIQKGDVVVTSGVGLIYPGGLRIGEVLGISRDRLGQFEVVDIKPFVKPEGLREVFIILDTGKPVLPWKRGLGDRLSQE